MRFSRRLKTLTRADRVLIAKNTPAGGSKTGLRAGQKTVWVMGGGKAQRLALDAGMFDSLCVFVMPVLPGSGRPCFAAGKHHNLNLVSSAELAGGILKIDYNIGE